MVGKKMKKLRRELHAGAREPPGTRRIPSRKEPEMKAKA